MKKIIVVGSSNTDLVIKTDRIPELGETVIGGTFMMTAGGKGANQAIAIARLGGSVSFVAKVGNDMFGQKSLEGYKKDGLDVSQIFVDDQTPSGVALIAVDNKGENCIVVAPGANNQLNKSDIFARRMLIEQADFLLLQLEVPMDVIEYACEIAFKKGTKIILNPAPAASLSDEILNKLYLITPNKTEAQMLTGVKIESWEDAQQAAHILIEKGIKNVIITLGSKGALVVGDHILEKIPAHKVQAIDTTAAGDTFNGALCVALAEGENLVDAVRFANKAAAISVTRLGAQTSIPYRKELS